MAVKGFAMKTQEDAITVTGVLLTFAVVCILIKLISLPLLWTVLLPWHYVLVPFEAWFVLLIIRTIEKIRAEPSPRRFDS